MSKSMQELRELSRKAIAERKAKGLLATKTPIEKAKEHPESLRKAVTAKCWECMGGGADPGVRRAVRDCTSPNCPLYPVRPWQNVC